MFKDKDLKKSYKNETGIEQKKGLIKNVALRNTS